MSLRDRFVAEFGEASALAIETAAQGHANGYNFLAGGAENAINN